jgi:hypothetical protein
VTRPRAADDFATIRARLKDLRRERERPDAAGNDLLSDPAAGRGRTDSRTRGEISAMPGRSANPAHHAASSIETAHA